MCDNILCLFKKKIFLRNGGVKQNNVWNCFSKDNQKEKKKEYF